MMKPYLLLRDDVFQMILLIFGLLYSVAVDATDYYCNESTPVVRVSGNTTGNIFTLFRGETFYRNNQMCQWLIDAGTDNARIHLTVTKSQLEWAPEGSICNDLYDYIDIKDGNSSSSRSIVVWCGYQSPRSVVSTGRYLLITFKSDPRNFYKYGGVHLTYNFYESSACPVLYSSPPDSQFCYSVVDNRQVNWNTAQMYCNFDQANLVSIETKMELDFLKSLVSDNGVAWIGLSKIVQEETFSWIDNSSLSYTNFDASLPENSDEDCVVFDFTTGLWHGRDCLRLKANFFCKTNKGKPTHLFGIPQKVKTKKDATAAPLTVILAAIFGSVGFFLVVVVVIIVYIKCYKGRNQQESSHRATYTASLDDEAGFGPKDVPTATAANRRPGRNAQRYATNSHRQPSAPPIERSSQLVAPPTYEDALNDPVFDIGMYTATN